MDIDAEREKITQEIKELERILDPSSSSIHVEVSESSLESDGDAGKLLSVARTAVPALGSCQLCTLWCCWDQAASRQDWLPPSPHWRQFVTVPSSLASRPAGCV